MRSRTMVTRIRWRVAMIEEPEYTDREFLQALGLAMVISIAMAAAMALSLCL